MPPSLAAKPPLPSACTSLSTLRTAHLMPRERGSAALESGTEVPHSRFYRSCCSLNSRYSVPATFCRLPPFVDPSVTLNSAEIPASPNCHSPSLSRGAYCQLTTMSCVPCSGDLNSGSTTFPCCGPAALSDFYSSGFGVRNSGEGSKLPPAGGVTYPTLIGCIGSNLV